MGAGGRLPGETAGVEQMPTESDLTIIALSCFELFQPHNPHQVVPEGRTFPSVASF